MSNQRNHVLSTFFFSAAFRAASSAAFALPVYAELQPLPCAPLPASLLEHHALSSRPGRLHASPACHASPAAPSWLHLSSAVPALRDKPRILPVYRISPEELSVLLPFSVLQPVLLFLGFQLRRFGLLLLLLFFLLLQRSSFCDFCFFGSLDLCKSCCFLFLLLLDFGLISQNFDSRHGTGEQYNKDSGRDHELLDL